MYGISLWHQFTWHKQQVTTMQSNIKNFFAKKGTSNTMASISSAGNSSSSSCSSPAPVKLVSYRAANSPAVTESTECPLKRKAPDSMSDYETSKRPRGYCSHWEREFPWLRYDAATDKMWCDVCREYQESLKNRTHASNGFIRGSDLWKKNLC